MIANANDIKESKILEVAKALITGLKPAGVNWKACCPFHKEKTPSFVVSPDKNLATCFGGCGQTWTPVNLVMEMEGVTYPEALERVAKINNITIRYQDRQKTLEQINREKEEKERKETLLLVNKYIQDVFQPNGLLFPCLDHGSVDYVLGAWEGHLLFDVFGRSYQAGTIEKFGLWVYPDDNVLVKNWKAWGLDREKLFHLGLIHISDKGDYDTFRGRLMFPLHNYDYSQSIAGFAGRISPHSKLTKAAKYRNSKESLAYNKRKMLYGLYQAKKAIMKEGRGFLVEGYTDTITMSENGFPNTVGQSGTALTPEQVKLMKKYADDWVMIPDYDPKFEDGRLASIPGMDAAKKNIEACIKGGIIPKVQIFPSYKDGIDKKVDADSFIREYSGNALLALMEDKDLGIQDGFLWLVRSIIGTNKEANALKTGLTKAVELLSKMDSFFREHYIKILTGAKWLHISKKEIESRILNKELAGKRATYIDDEMSAEQEYDWRRYKIFIGTNNPKLKEKYMKLADNGLHVPLTNFIIRPIYHVYSNQEPARKVEIINEEGESFILDLGTDKFTTKDNFEKAVEVFGNFVFTGDCRKGDYTNIKRKLYAEMETVYRISTLGQHSMGFFSWSNGITLPDGTFTNCMHDGRVTVDSKNFVVPGFDVEEEQNKLSDDAPNTDSHIKLFRMVKGETFNFKTWCELMLQVHGQNGYMLIAYYLAAVNRDQLWPERFKGFPILNLFGPPQKGKSTACWSLSAMFGKPRVPINQHDCTTAGMNARQEQTKNGLVWITEYKNDVMKYQIELLKKMWDGTGRERRSGERKKSTEQTVVNNAVLLDGQHLPTADIALLTRCITLLFEGYDSTPEGLAAFAKLEKEQDSGRLSQITGVLQQYRNLIDEKFDKAFLEAKSAVKMHLGDFNEERVINNHVIPLAVIKVLEDVLDFPTKEDIPFSVTLEGFVVELILRQAKYIESEDEQGDFWRRMYDMAVRGKLKHGTHIIVQEEKEISLYDADAKKDTLEAGQQFDVPTKLIFMHIEGCHSLYQEHYKMATGGKGMGVMELKLYLQQSKPYLGRKKAKRFKNGTLSAMVFDATKLESLGIDFRLTKQALATLEDHGKNKEGDKNGNPYDPTNNGNGGPKDDLSF